MAEMNRRGFLRILRRTETADETTDEKTEEREPSAKELQIRELAEFTARLLADVEAENDEPLAEGALHTKAYDLAYMRVTSGHIAFSRVTGFSTVIQVSDVRAFETEPPVDVHGYGSTVIALLHAHHPADPDTVTRSFSFRFPTESPLIPAIRSACDIPEPEPEPESEAEEAEEAPEPAPAD
jgi:hypothetical protein